MLNTSDFSLTALNLAIFGSKSKCTQQPNKAPSSMSSYLHSVFLGPAHVGQACLVWTGSPSPAELRWGDRGHFSTPPAGQASILSQNA